MSHYHRAYGLNFASDIALLPLQELAQPDTIDVEIRYQDGLLQKYISDNQAYQVVNKDNGVVLFFPGIAVFEISAGKLVRVEVVGDDLQSVRLYLLGSCMAALWYQRHAWLLHANVIKIGQSAIAVAAYSGSGKSTLAAEFYHRGYHILADDVCVIDQQLNVQPGYPFLKLWRETIDKLSLENTDLIKIRLQKNKYYFPVGAAFYDAPLRLSAVYVLRKMDGIHKLAMVPLEGIAKMRALHYHAYRSVYLDKMESEQQREFWQRLIALSAKMRITRILRPDSGFSVGEIADFIVKEASQLEDSRD